MSAVRRHDLRRWFVPIAAPITALIVLALSGCVSPPDNVTPVSNFEASRYVGTWYEIARLDHRFERGLERVTATYNARADGGLQVINRGFDTASGDWEQAEGRAYFIDTRDRGLLKVSFFRPFYASYVIFDLSDDYRTAFVTSDGADTLWFLSRAATVDADQRRRFIDATRALGIDPARLIWVEQTAP